MTIEEILKAGFETPVTWKNPPHGRLKLSGYCKIISHDGVYVQFGNEAVFTRFMTGSRAKAPARPGELHIANLKLLNPEKKPRLMHVANSATAVLQHHTEVEAIAAMKHASNLKYTLVMNDRPKTNNLYPHSRQIILHRQMTPSQICSAIQKVLLKNGDTIYTGIDFFIDSHFTQNA